MKLKILITILIGLMIINVNAMSFITELNCTNQSITFQNRVVVLNAQNTAGPHVYRLQNLAEQTVQLNHSTGVGMQAGVASNIDPQHVSAMLIQQSSFFLSCAYLNAEGVPRTVDCENVITACEIENIVYPVDPSMSQGQYWIAENRSSDDFNNALIQRGFKLR